MSHAKRRRTQSSVLSFFQADPPSPPSIPSAPSSEITSPNRSVVVSEPAVAETKPENAVRQLGHGVDVRPPPSSFTVCKLPGVDVHASVGSPVTPDDVTKRHDCEMQQKSEQHDLEDDIEEIPDDDEDEDEWQPISRLSRSRNMPRRSTRRRTERLREDHENEPIVTEPVPEELTTPVQSSDIQILAATEASAGAGPPSSTPKPKKLHPSFTSKEIDAPKPVQRKKLHPFFAATAAALCNAKERKRPRPVASSMDAWECPSATVHVCAPQPLGPFHRSPGVPEPTKQASVVAPVNYSLYDRWSETSSRPVESFPCKNPDTWAERYKRDRRIDVINGAAMKELVDWLRDWYETRDFEQSDDSQDSFMMSNEVGSNERERVAIVTGPVGCGKSTVIANAARQLGLSILEINSSVCRTGKRIREIIGEALSTHRVTHQPVFQSFKAKSEQAAKTLVVFEEVDELHDDEKGFWSTIHKLAASSDCRRPIVCTANSFNAQMRQYFIQSRATVEEDMEKLLINSPGEQLINPIEYKLIEFQSRSERQAAAVVNRVCSSESAAAVNSISNCLALTCKDDTRKAINLLQFWGSKGLVYEFLSPTRRTHRGPPKRARHVSAETQGKIGVELVLATSTEEHGVSPFWIGSSNYVNIACDEKNSSTAKGTSATNDDVLDTWCTSLEAMSFADSIEGIVEGEKLKRNFDLSEEALNTCMDTDLRQAEVVAKEIDMLSLRYSSAYLSFATGAKDVNEMARAAMASHSPPSSVEGSQLPLPRRPVSLEYLPILRCMALADERASNASGSGNDGHDRPMRRTRARARRGGFCSLDLDPITILALKKNAIRTD